MKWYLKFLFICAVFILGSWFGQAFTEMHYDKKLAEERSSCAAKKQVAVENVLGQIDIKFCAQWNVSVPPYDDSVANYVNKGEIEND